MFETEAADLKIWIFVAFKQIVLGLNFLPRLHPFRNIQFEWPNRLQAVKKFRNQVWANPNVDQCGGSWTERQDWANFLLLFNILLLGIVLKITEVAQIFGPLFSHGKS
jgi:hypothetical protein